MGGERVIHRTQWQACRIKISMQTWKERSQPLLLENVMVYTRNQGHVRYVGYVLHSYLLFVCFMIFTLHFANSIYQLNLQILKVRAIKFLNNLYHICFVQDSKNFVLNLFVLFQQPNPLLRFTILSFISASGTSS